MPAPQSDAYVVLDSSFQTSSGTSQSQHSPRRNDDHRTYSKTAAPLRRDYSYSTQATDTTDETGSTCSQDSTPLASSAALNRGESGLPPTPPSASQDGESIQDPEPPPLADSVRNSLMSQKSSLSTPVNARSPPTPDPSPPRTIASNATSERPHLLTYPSSRADSFQTAREEPLSSDRDDSRSVTPANDRLSTVEEDRGLGLAFDYVENNITPTTQKGGVFPTTPTRPTTVHVDSTVGAEEDKGSQTVHVPDREWNTDLMRNVTIRKKRRTQTTDSPRKIPDPAVTVVEAASPTPSNRTRRASSLRERVEASHHSPVTPSIENFAQSIGWPAEPAGMSGEKYRDSTNKRLSTASVASTVVSAHVIVTPPQRRHTLRHSGRNMAYRRDVSSPADLGPGATNSNRNSVVSQFDGLPPRRLVHKRTNIGDRSIRSSTDSNILGSDRTMSPSLSLRQRTIDSSAHTLAHQESIRNVLQPASDILSRHSSGARAGGSYHKRINSAPEPVKRKPQPSKLRNFSELSPPGSPRPKEAPVVQPPKVERAPSPTLSPKPRRGSPTSRKSRRQQTPVISDVRLPAGMENTLPDLPDQGVDGPAERDVFLGASHPPEETRVPPELMDRVRRLVAGDPTEEPTFIGEYSQNPATAEYLNNFSPLDNGSRQIPLGSRFTRPSSRDQKRASPNRDNFSLSPDMATRPRLDDRMSSEEMARYNHEWRRCSSGTPGRGVSFDQSGSRSASRMEEHAMARHLYSQSTPFSQFSDTVEVTEATAVSIYPHNNNSLLVVQQMSRGNSMIQERRQLTTDTHMRPQGGDEMPISPTPPFVDAEEKSPEECKEAPPQPTLNFEPSTPPMQLELPQPNGVDIPLQNPRSPPKPPKIMFIPPTPMEELENQLAPPPPGPPQRSDSHPQRRLSVLQRARRYSGNLIAPVLARASSKPRQNNETQRHSHHIPRVPSVTDEDGTLHPFWRPRGFWDGFEDSDSDGDDGGLPEGGDTSDIEDSEPEPPRRPNKLNKLKGGLRNSGGFLIGNSLGVERHGTNKRRHQITLPPNFPRQPRTRSTGRSSPPKVIIQAPTHALGRHGGGGIQKRRSTPELRRTPSLSDNDNDNVSIEYEQSRRRGSWRQGRSLPGLKKYHVQYIGLSGVKDKFRERRTEKRREKIRRSIGSRYYVEPVDVGVGVAEGSVRSTRTGTTGSQAGGSRTGKADEE
ncbi:transporter MCH4 [Pyrenophora seminiperda CCB06]|uniref:Transporter MCH4 n=1 Tax=Pyrenophora seminiperda CCB06 TaxID=1302712 RepID=A0A3M7M239_9PLEO|nr:transporter MCH4 [Pyrenophora seminiperda CCB06]